MSRCCPRLPNATLRDDYATMVKYDALGNVAWLRDTSIAGDVVHGSDGVWQFNTTQAALVDTDGACILPPIDYANLGITSIFSVNGEPVAFADDGQLEALVTVSESGVIKLAALSIQTDGTAALGATKYNLTGGSQQIVSASVDQANRRPSRKYYFRAASSNDTVWIVTMASGNLSASTVSCPVAGIPTKAAGEGCLIFQDSFGSRTIFADESGSTILDYPLSAPYRFVVHNHANNAVTCIEGTSQPRHRILPDFEYFTAGALFEPWLLSSTEFLAHDYFSLSPSANSATYLIEYVSDPSHLNYTNTTLDTVEIRTSSGGSLVRPMLNESYVAGGVCYGKFPASDLDIPGSSVPFVGAYSTSEQRVIYARRAATGGAVGKPALGTAGVVYYRLARKLVTNFEDTDYIYREPAPE